MAGYIGVDGTAKRVNALYVGVDGTARRVVKAYVGDENGKARLWMALKTISFTLLIPKSSPVAESEKKTVVCHALDGMTWAEWFISEYNPIENCVIMLYPTSNSIGVLQLTLDDGFTKYQPLPQLGDLHKPTDGATYDLSRGSDPVWYEPVSDKGGGV